MGSHLVFQVWLCPTLSDFCQYCPPWVSVSPSGKYGRSPLHPMPSVTIAKAQGSSYLLKEG